MRRTALFLLVGTVSAIAVACHDSMVAPASNRGSLSTSSASFSQSGAGNNERSVIATLTISTAGGTYHVGDFDVVIPANAVCDPKTTPYGPQHWDSDCRPANRSITVNVVAERHKDRVTVDFQPDLRFRPSAGWVTVRTDAYRDLLTSDALRQLSVSSSYFNNFAILYVPTGGNSRVDEVRSTGDASLVTHVDLGSGIVWRRVKHFSGYMINSGFQCNSSTAADPTCPVDDGSGLGGNATAGASLSGFVLVGGVSLPSVLVIPNDSTSQH